MWVRLGSVESESTKLVPFKALAMAPSHVPGIGELQSTSDCCRAFQVEPWVHTERVLQCLLQHICCCLAMWVVLMFPCVEEMKRPVALAGRRGGAHCVLATWRRKSLKAETSRMRRSHNCSEQTGLRRVPGRLLRCRVPGRSQAGVECRCWAGS